MKKIIVLALLHTGVAVSDLPKIINLPKIQLPKERKDAQNLLSLLGAQNEAEGAQKATVLVNDQNSLKIIKGIIGEQDTTKAIDILQSVQRAIPSLTSLRNAPEKIKALTLDQGHLERVKRIMQQNDVEQLIKTIGSMQDTIKNQKNEIEALKKYQASSLPVAPPVLGTPQAPNIPPAPPITTAPNIPIAPPIPVAPPVKQPSPSTPPNRPSKGPDSSKPNPSKQSNNELLDAIRGGKKLNPVSSNPRPAEIPKKDDNSLKGTLERAMDERRRNIREGDEEDNGADDSEWN